MSCVQLSPQAPNSQNELLCSGKVLSWKCESALRMQSFLESLPDFSSITSLLLPASEPMAQRLFQFSMGPIFEFEHIFLSPSLRYSFPVLYGIEFCQPSKSQLCCHLLHRLCVHSQMIELSYPDLVHSERPFFLPWFSLISPCLSLGRGLTRNSRRPKFVLLPFKK